MDYRTTPVIEINHPVAEKAGIRLLVKCEYQNHSDISGNKWWKLKYNLEEARLKGYSKLLTFGGAFSNHIYATAAAAHETGFQSIGIIRGDEASSGNPTLTFARSKEMELHFISREMYREKTDPAYIDELHNKFGDFYLIPEGGTNTLAVKGCSEFASEFLEPLEFDALYLPVGTGGTIAGIVHGLGGRRRIYGIAVLKQGDFLRHDVSSLLKTFDNVSYGNWDVLTSYHHGGYAKVSDELKRFIVSMKVEHNLPLDHVYTAKLMWGVMEEIKSGNLPRGSTVLALHTGGLQESSL